MAHTELGLRERRTIEDMLNVGISVDKIATEIGRHRSTVYREIKRNRYTDDELPYLDGYYGMTAQRSAKQRRARRRKLVRLEDLRRHVIKQLEIGWSPEQIAGRLQYDGQPVRVSHETIYAYVYGPDGQSEELARYLPHRRKKRQPRRRRTPRGLVFPPDRSIHERPDYVKTRETFGHWECDLMMFRKEHGKVNVTSLVERVSRYAVVMRNEDRQPKPIMEALIQSLAPLPAHARQSITFDRGTEFSAWRNLKAGIGADAWFCDPQAPYQKGTVENTNNRLRRYLPRSTAPTALTNRYLRSICQRLNSTPRKCLGYRTPAEVFETKLMEIQNRLE
ncbi:IS30 family transposase [Roseovarius sp. S4756]|uniref:IS30 family transposase n=1 Tax=Roseovarius maritimus TaxID=3342637 RepID=UPI003729E6F5